MQYPKPKQSARNPYTVEREFAPIAISYTYEVHVTQDNCTVITFHYSQEAAERERQFQAQHVGNPAEIKEAKSRNI